MAFYGKFFAVEREENYEAFVKSMGLSEEKEKKFLQFKPVQKYEKKGDEYVFTIQTPEGEKNTKFKSGVEFTSTFRDRPMTTTITVDGNKITQVIKFESGFTMTIKKEYTDDTLSEELTHSKWDGTARRFFKAQ
ncbi:unnamed protein product [Parnassius apollo]|uniref:(apollo) hypothetical protein n=1 Tax=Parnassius apollo TaxID=110799 RepID=A0A8S3XH09_PARAO|nr:unnamed protein product [Parnassius apollo]